MRTRGICLSALLALPAAPCMPYRLGGHRPCIMARCCRLPSDAARAGPLTAVACTTDTAGCVGLQGEGRRRCRQLNHRCAPTRSHVAVARPCPRMAGRARQGCCGTLSHAPPPDGATTCITCGCGRTAGPPCRCGGLECCYSQSPILPTRVSSHAAAGDAATAVAMPSSAPTNPTTVREGQCPACKLGRLGRRTATCKWRGGP